MNDTFERSTLKYIVNTRIGASFKSHEEAMTYSNSDELFKDPNFTKAPIGEDGFSVAGRSQGLDPTVVAHDLLKKAIGIALDDRKDKPKRRDTSLGGNEAINCYYQFNENDDIIHPMTAVVGNNEYSCTEGLGRVYNETFDEQQQIVWMSFGVPDFSDMKSFYGSLIDRDLAALQNTGEIPLLKTLFRITAWATTSIAFFPFIAIKWGLGLLTKPNMISPSKYYDFKATMPLYFKTVNSMLAHVAVNMGLVNIEAFEEKTEFGKDPRGVPDLFKKRGLDILAILDKKRIYDEGANGNPISTDEELNKLIGIVKDEKNTGFFNSIGNAASSFATGFNSAVTESKAFVGFRMEKSTDSSESASNTTGESEVAQMINSQAERGRSIKFNMMEGNVIGGAAGSVVGGFMDAMSGLANGIADVIGMDAPLEVFKGSGFVDIPEVWKSSSFSKSYSFNFQLRSPSGDPVSIFYSIYVPLLMLMAASFPRAVGQNAYTSPFVVRMYSRGMVSIPLGMIESISIRRGSSEYGWNKNVLPTCVDVSISVKDLSPMMYVALADGSQSAWDTVFGQNSSYQEYLLTLSGVGVADRLLYIDRIINRGRVLLKLLHTNKLNPAMWGFSLGAGTLVGQALTNLWVTSKLPEIKE